MLTKLSDRLRRDGFRVTARAALARVRKRLYLREQHVWYGCDLNGRRPRRELADDVRFVHADERQVDAVAQLGQSVEQARERRAEGNDIWLVLDGSQALFACYTFRRTAPVAAASQGVLPLPPGIACLEDSVTGPAARGRGIAPGAWTRIGDRLADDGFSVLVTKIESDNAASRKAVEKVGFRPLAVMDHRRVGPRRRTSVRALDDTLGPELGARLS